MRIIEECMGIAILHTQIKLRKNFTTYELEVEYAYDSYDGNIEIRKLNGVCDNSRLLNDREYTEIAEFLKINLKPQVIFVS